MKIAGIKKQSLIDYPGNISTIVFTQGCNFRCGFCHNPNLVLPDKFGATYKEEQLFDYLHKNKKFIDAVTITGGEPTLHKGLPNFIKKIKRLNLKVKLDTNGTNPDLLQNLFDNKLIDFIAMDIKHVLEFEPYNLIVGSCINKKIFSKILLSIHLIKKSEIEYEFRTTVLKNFHSINQIEKLKQKFGQYYKIQKFNPEVVLAPNINMAAYSENEHKNFF